MKKIVSKANHLGKPNASEVPEIEREMCRTAPPPAGTCPQTKHPKFSVKDLQKGLEVEEPVVPDHRPFIWPGESEIWAMQKAELVESFDYQMAATLWNSFSSTHVTPDCLKRDLRSMLLRLRWEMLGSESEALRICVSEGWISVALRAVESDFETVVARENLEYLLSLATARKMSAN